MSESRLQPSRFVAEQGQRSKLAANVVGSHYRLGATDLPAGSIVTTVRAVTLQGLDAPAPVLHGERLPHPLVLDRENVQALTRLTGSPLFADWIGCKVALHVVRQGNAQRIALTAPGAAPPAPVPGPPRLHRSHMGKVVLVTILCCAVVALAVVLATQWPSFSLTLPR